MRFCSIQIFFSDLESLVFKKILNFYWKKVKKTDALVGRVWTFHILQTSELAFSIFRKIHRELPETDGLRSILYIYRKNIQNLSGKLSGKTEKRNIGIHWYASSSKAWSKRISTCYPNGLRLIFDLFSRKFQSFSGKLLSEFQKIANLNVNF
jgi:hypothetical protein